MFSLRNVTIRYESIRLLKKNRVAVMQLGVWWPVSLPRNTLESFAKTDLVNLFMHYKTKTLAFNPGGQRRHLGYDIGALGCSLRV